MYIYLGWFRVFGVSYKADVRGQYLSKSLSGCINIEHKTYVNLARKQINLRYSTKRRYLNRVSLREQFPSYILEWGGSCLKPFVEFIFKGLTDCVFASRILFDSRAPWVCLHLLSSLFIWKLINYCVNKLKEIDYATKDTFNFDLEIIWIYPVNATLWYISEKFENIPSDLFDN